MRAAQESYRRSARGRRVGAARQKRYRANQSVKFVTHHPATEAFPGGSMTLSASLSMPAEPEAPLHVVPVQCTPLPQTATVPPSLGETQAYLKHCSVCRTRLSLFTSRGRAHGARSSRRSRAPHLPDGDHARTR
jgi:hypothetical protein